MKSPAKDFARTIQRRLEHLYWLEETPNIVDFVRFGSESSRETLLLRESGGELEMALVLPPESEAGRLTSSGLAHDLALQVLEGVSHFVYVAERARTRLPATQLELELQAEVDKFALLALERTGPGSPAARQLHKRLFEQVSFLHESGTEAGDRYRYANDLAARFASRLLGRRPSAAREMLRCFYRSGQNEKIRLAAAA